MIDPADSDRLRNAVSLQGATIEKHEELLQSLMEGLHTLSGRHDQGFKMLLEQFRGPSIRQHSTTEASRTLSNSPASDHFVPTLPSREPRLHQEPRSVADYTVDFHTLAAESACNPESLFDTFLHGLSKDIKDNLAAWELLLALDSFIALTIRNDGRLWERRKERSVFSPTRSSTAACSPQKNPGSPQHLHFQEDLKSPESPRDHRE